MLMCDSYVMQALHYVGGGAGAKINGLSEWVSSQLFQIRIYFLTLDFSTHHFDLIKMLSTYKLS